MEEKKKININLTVWIIIMILLVITLGVMYYLDFGKNKSEHYCCSCLDCPECDKCCDCHNPYLNKENKAFEKSDDDD